MGGAAPGVISSYCMKLPGGGLLCLRTSHPHPRQKAGGQEDLEIKKGSSSRRVPLPLIGHHWVICPRFDQSQARGMWCQDWCGPITAHPFQEWPYL